MTREPPRTVADPGFLLCDNCEGTRVCPTCDGHGYLLDAPPVLGRSGAPRCSDCDWGGCEQCHCEGQLPADWKPPEDPAPAPQTITFEQGHEFAADSPWGYHRLSVATNGSLEYEHRARGVHRSLRGTVDGERVKLLDAALGRTSYPQKPQEKFRPGGSIIKIATSPPAYSVMIDYFEGMKLDGYREVIRDLSELNNALREDDGAVLSTWRFERAPEVAT